MAAMPSNTDRLIANFEHAEREGCLPVNFMVGRYTGNGPSVVPALRRRGFIVERTHHGYAIKGRAVAISTPTVQGEPVMPDANALDGLQNEVQQEFDHAGQRWSFNGDELAVLDEEEGCFHSVAYHRLTNPTVGSVTAFIDSM